MREGTTKKLKEYLLAGNSVTTLEINRIFSTVDGRKRLSEAKRDLCAIGYQFEVVTEHNNGKKYLRHRICNIKEVRDFSSAKSEIREPEKQNFKEQTLFPLDAFPL